MKSGISYRKSIRWFVAIELLLILAIGFVLALILLSGLDPKKTGIKITHFPGFMQYVIVAMQILLVLQLLFSLIWAGYQFYHKKIGRGILLSLNTGFLTAVLCVFYVVFTLGVVAEAGDITLDGPKAGKVHVAGHRKP